MPDAVIWDLDGVLLDSEALWDAARRAVATEAGGHWTDEATVALQGMSAPSGRRICATSSVWRCRLPRSPARSSNE